jgi:DNA-binding NtrC family response regulator
MTDKSAALRRPRSLSRRSPNIGPVVVRRGPNDEECAELAAGDRLVVGSAPMSMLRVEDEDVAGEHCEIVHRGSAIEIRDLGTVAGTFLFGARVSSALVRPPVKVALGEQGARIRIALAKSPESVGAEPLPGLAGDSPEMLRVAECVRRFAKVRLPVLIRGESGVGKELVARALHDLGPRQAGPFVAINAASFSRELAESELFGHVRGAFTGATCDRRGAFREAHCGTLFIDEIAALSREVQAKLLRVVEDGVIRPLGGDTRVTVDVRLVAATCEPLERMVEERLFREDLYERIAVCVVRVPALRERAADIPTIANALLSASGIEAVIGRDAMSILIAHHYRGNVRELRNVLVQCALHADSPVIEADDVVAVLSARGGPVRPKLASGDAVRWLDACEGNVARAARTLGVPRSTFRDRLRGELAERRARSGAASFEGTS